MSAIQKFPSEHLRDALTRRLGLDRDKHERRVLRTMLYQLDLFIEDGASADDLAQLLLDSAQGPISSPLGE